ncbi:MAG: DJ-1/PfpI family protein, partial [Planctomycetota bacterium]
MRRLAGVAVSCLLFGTALLGDDQRESVVVGFLVEDGIRGSELSEPLDVLHHVRFHAEPATRVLTIARNCGEIRTFEGLEIAPDADCGTAPELDVLVLPGAERYGREPFDDPELIRFVRERASRARFVLSLGDAAFVLARAGLLDDRSCTTRPDGISALRDRFPGARVIDGLSFAVDGTVITSAGGGRSREAALYLVERLYGELTAIDVARGLVIDWSLEAIPHYIAQEGATRSYDVGETIDPEVEVEDAAGARHRLLSLPGEEDLVIVLFLFGGGGDRREFHRAGIWCEDSMNELPLMRHMRARFRDRPVAFLPVACPPVFDEEQFGYPSGCFEESSADHVAARAAFVKATRDAVDSGLIPFDTVYYDPGFKLMRGPDTAGAPSEEAREEAPSWAGRFRARDEYQQYGLPTIWILSREGKVLMPPFRGNRYEKDLTLIYTARELHTAISRAL